MSIYPERNRAGDFTGKWISETAKGGVRRKARANTFEEAQALEAQLLGSPSVPTSAYTMLNLFREASPKIWRGTKDELRSTSRAWNAVEALGPNLPVASVTYARLETLVDRLYSDGLKGKTVNRYLAALSALFSWAEKAGRIPHAPKVPRQPETKGRKAWLPEDLTEAFLRTIADQSGPDCAFAAEVLLLTGMRANELLSLSPTEVVKDVVYLSRTKTDSPRALPLPEGMGEILRAWVSFDRSGYETYRDLLKACKRASEALGLVPQVTPHVLRHTVATRLTAQGVPTLTVAAIMGHRSLETTRGYTHHEVSSLKVAMVTLMQGTRVATKAAGGPAGDLSKHRANSEVIDNAGSFGGLGGNRTPVQGFAVLPARPTKGLR